jgi:uncharacterized OsmC-like protein
MSMHEVAAAMQRVETVLRRRPEAGVHDDAPATASWQSGTRVVASHANGTTVSTDMPAEFGGSGDRVSPGWLFRAGMAACASTTIAMQAARLGVALSALEVQARSRSDSRGLLGMTDATGEAVPAGPLAIELSVRIAAPGVEPEKLRELVESSYRCSPIPDAVRRATPLDLHVEVGGA